MVKKKELMEGFNKSINNIINKDLKLDFCE